MKNNKKTFSYPYALLFIILALVAGGSSFAWDQDIHHQPPSLYDTLDLRIWAVTPEVLDELGLDMSDSQLRSEYMELFKRQPLIYNNLNAKFNF